MFIVIQMCIVLVLLRAMYKNYVIHHGEFSNTQHTKIYDSRLVVGILYNSTFIFYSMNNNITITY